MREITYTGWNSNKFGIKNGADVNAVLIIPIKGREPILVFKIWGSPYYYKELIEGHEVILCDYRIFWRNKNYGHKFPQILYKQYGKDVKLRLMQKSEEGNIDIDVNILPKHVNEYSLKAIKEKQDYKHQRIPYIKVIRKTLKKLGVIYEVLKRNRQSFLTKKRNEFFIREYKRLREPERIPNNRILKSWYIYAVERLYIKDEKLYRCSEATVRRVVQAYIKS